ncbi:1-phosphofructokinase family hexose kinase [Clostridium boliviensis]|uniref:Tagatose-6-phosphate kinase n=1 Tax=Clostridium boliviensis TaxID=318465 RepID=A0ABU4GJE7_9CLOT|nr:1-phosphofructokinase family hexose kinase [Clostridium boliviensis]MDW2797733.1 1-phosphofructokinase family hexose kinase [Clostridium boliviensis]
MIYTLTANPAIDMNLSSCGIMGKVVNRTFDAVYTPNGKGLNVSYCLKRFQTQSAVLGFFGGFSGRFVVDETRKRGIKTYPVWVNDTTRINIFLNDGKEEYKFVNEGSYVSPGKQKNLYRLLETLNDMDTLIISGSLPKGVKDSFYDEVMEICQRKRTPVILDISSPHLKYLIGCRPYLIKPNDEEIKEIFGIVMRDEADVKDVLKDLYESGARNILLTLGDRGSYFYNGSALYHAGTKKVRLVSSACAGDAALAGFLSIWMNQPYEIEGALKRSAAVGANVAESSGLGLMDRVEDYTKEIIVRKVEGV